MIDVLADIGFAAMLAIGLVLIVGFLMVANLSDVRNVEHPGGKYGRLRDEGLVLAGLAPWLCMVLAGAIWPQLRDLAWWYPTFAVLAVAGLAFGFSAPVRRARQRIEALRRSPPQ